MAEKDTDQRKGREGARWINERPTPEEFAKWAKDNIPIHTSLNIEDYVGGIVLIPAVDKKSKFVEGFTSQGEPKIGERPEMVYVPYAKVETRLQYFWDLLTLNEDKWVGVIEPIVTERPELEMLAEHILETPPDEFAADGVPTTERDIYKATAAAAIVHQLPPGFFIMPVPMGTGYSYFLCCSYRVAIYERDNAKEASRPIREGRGTKQVPLIVKGWNDSVKVDENAIMKAETGAIGRALGAAGIFTIPGSGIATAEDMLEQALGGEVAPVEEGAGPAAPAEKPAPAAAAGEKDDEKETLASCQRIIADLQENFPAAYEAFGKWCMARRPKITSLDGLQPAALRGVLSKLGKLHAEAVERQEARGEAPAGAEGEKQVDDPPSASGAKSAKAVGLDLGRQEAREARDGAPGERTLAEAAREATQTPGAPAESPEAPGTERPVAGEEESPALL